MLTAAAPPAAGPVQFRAHDIDANFRAGYAVGVADFNNDGRLDVIANSLQVNELAWYANPPSLASKSETGVGGTSSRWERHVIVPEMQSIVNQAMADLDGDGIPELAFQSHFAMQAAKSPGHNWIARSQGDPRQPWKTEKIDTFPTSHHVAFADLDGDGRKELLNAPLIGEKSLAPTYDQDKAALFWYDAKTWTRHVVTTDIPGIVHRVRPVNWDDDKREEFLVASFEGVALYKAIGSGVGMEFQKTLLSAGHTGKAPRLGSTDAGMGRHDGKKFFASVEPWHGNEVVVYNDVNGKWQRRVVFDNVGSGHEIAVVDLNGDGRWDVVANDNSRVTEQRPNATPGVHVFYAPDDPVNGEWTYQRLEDKLAMNSCVGADLNSDKRIDLVCTGAGGVLRWYENLHSRSLVAEDLAGSGGTRPPPVSPELSIRIDTRLAPPSWAVLQRQLLAASVPAAREFFNKYFDDRGYLQCFVRWGANDGPDDAFENFNRWPELHALGASDEILRMYLKGHEGLLRQYSEARTTDVPIAREGMYHKEFIVQSDWMHHGEGLQLFNRMGLSIPTDRTYQQRARRFAGLYMGEDPEAPNYDPDHKIIRSMQNGSRGPMLRKATALDWVGDPFDVKGFDAEHGESSFTQFLAHYEEYTDVVGDHFLNLAATTLPTNAYLLAGEAKYKTWIVEYMDAWLDRMRRNGGIIPSFVDLDGTIGGPEGKWWGNAYGWGFSPINPVTGAREDRNRIQWALPGFNNALLVTGQQKYVDAWRNMIDAVNSHSRVAAETRKQYPSMHGANGWYGWRDTPWNVGALEVWYWSQKPQDLARVGKNPWVDFLSGKNPAYPEQALGRDLEAIKDRVNAMRRDRTPPEKRLADNMLEYNPVATESLVQLMWGALMPGRSGGLLNARLRYFDPVRKRAGVPEDVAALVSELSDTSTTVTLINLNRSETRTVIVQGGGYSEHQLISVTQGATTTPINSPLLTVHLEPGSGQTLVFAMRRYANPPTVLHPWHHREIGEIKEIERKEIQGDQGDPGVKKE